MSQMEQIKEIKSTISQLIKAFDTMYTNMLEIDAKVKSLESELSSFSSEVKSVEEKECAMIASEEILRKEYERLTLTLTEGFKDVIRRTDGHNI